MRKIFLAKHILSIFLLFSFLDFSYAEYNSATKKDELILISTDQEVSMGRSIARSVEKQMGVVQDEREVRRVYDIGQRLAAVSERRDVDYRFRILKGKDVNAFALPGGYIYVFKGLLDELKSDDELAIVLGHEIGHVVCRHSVKRIQTGVGYNILRIATAVGTKDPQLTSGMDIAFASVTTAYSREDELLADELAIKYAKKAGFDPNASFKLFDFFREYHSKEPLRVFSYWRTHPYLDDRIRHARMTITGRITFEDYINDGRDRA